MENSRYPVIIGKSSMVFEFISDGLNGKVAKLVIYSETDLLNFYNLGFGDKDSSGQIDDKNSN